MNSNRRKASEIRGIIVVVLIMSLLVTVQAVAASASIPQFDPVQVGPFLVTLQTATFNPDDTSDWTYEIKVTEALQNAVSHSSLGLLDPQCLIVDYSDDGTFRVEFPAMEGSQEVIKWENVTEGIKNVGESHTFTVKVLGAQVDTSDPHGMYVAVKYGMSFVDGSVEGPICGTTAVSMAAMSAKSGMQTPFLMIILALGATVATAGVLRKADRS